MADEGRKKAQRSSKYIALTGDENKAIIGKNTTENVLRDQRDQALKEIGELRKEIESLKAIIKNQEKELSSMTVARLFKRKLLYWLST